MAGRRSILDVSWFLRAANPSWAMKITWMLTGLGLSAFLRAVVGLITPAISPFSFVYPGILLATLGAGWQSGTLAAIIAVVAAELIVVVPGAAQHGYQLGTAASAAINVAAVVWLAQIFRASVQHVLERENAEIAERDLLYRELQHRVGNDFNLVHTLLDEQRKVSEDAGVRAAIGAALGRIRSIARVHRQLYSLPESFDVDMVTYLKDLCAGLADATLPPAGVTLRCHSDRAIMRREDALAIGLITNELIINAVKHAFPDGREGVIDVRFVHNNAGWRLTIADDGVGVPGYQPNYGLGRGLIEQLVQRIDGALKLESKNGTRAILDLPETIARLP